MEEIYADIAIDCKQISKTYFTEVGHTINALNSISFSVTKGTVMGIVGKNGCGKSTLLKILAGIVKPTSGNVVLTGRVLSVLEVGTGFHYELTGRENIFMNGKLHGFSSVEINGLTESIIEFSDIGAFIDEPVRTYSQGMYLRLAMAMVFFMDADIYIFDEVLSVGDEGFQKKCFYRFQQLAASGKTILLVSQNFAQMAAVCNRCLVLYEGGIVADGAPLRVHQEFQQSLSKSAFAAEFDASPVFNIVLDGYLELISFRLNKSCKSVKVQVENELVFEIIWKKLVADMKICFHIDIYSEDRRVIINTANVYGTEMYDMQSGETEDSNTVYTTACRVPPYFLNTGNFYAHMTCTSYYNAANFRVVMETVAPLHFMIVDEKSPDSKSLWTFSSAPVRTKFDWLSYRS